MREEKEKENLTQYQINIVKFDYQSNISSLKGNIKELQNGKTILKNIISYFLK
jgi:hypothetical protein